MIAKIPTHPTGARAVGVQPNLSAAPSMGGYGQHPSGQYPYGQGNHTFASTSIPQQGPGRVTAGTYVAQPPLPLSSVVRAPPLMAAPSASTNLQVSQVGGYGAAPHGLQSQQQMLPAAQTQHVPVYAQGGGYRPAPLTAPAPVHVNPAQQVPHHPFSQPPTGLIPVPQPGAALPPPRAYSQSAGYYAANLQHGGHQDRPGSAPKHHGSRGGAQVGRKPRHESKNAFLPHQKTRATPAGWIVNNRKREDPRLNTSTNPISLDDSIDSQLVKWHEERAQLPNFWQVTTAILDTNILIHGEHPEILDDLREAMPNLKVIVPYVMIQELDGLKTRPNIGSNVQIAINRLHLLIVTNAKKTTWIRSQKPDETLPLPGVVAKNNDDRILEIANYFNTYSKAPHKAMLLTNDKNLQLKATSFNITTGGWADIMRFSSGRQELERERAPLRALVVAAKATDSNRQDPDLRLEDYDPDTEQDEDDEFKQVKLERERAAQALKEAEEAKLLAIEREKKRQEHRADVLSRVPTDIKKDLYDSSSDEESSSAPPSDSSDSSDSESDSHRGKSSNDKNSKKRKRSDSDEEREMKPPTTKRASLARSAPSVPRSSDIVVIED